MMTDHHAAARMGVAAAAMLMDEATIPSDIPNIYFTGRVPDAVVRDRRRKNRVSRASRRINRRVRR